MAFPLYLSYLTAEQKPAACFVPSQSGGGGGGGVGTAATGNATASARSTGSASTTTSQGQAKSTSDGAPVPVVPMDCYEDMFHEIAKKFYGEGALVQGGIVQGTDQNGTGGNQQQSQSELGLMDLDYQQVRNANGFGPPNPRMAKLISSSFSMLLDLCSCLQFLSRNQKITKLIFSQFVFLNFRWGRTVITSLVKAMAQCRP